MPCQRLFASPPSNPHTGKRAFSTTFCGVASPTPKSGIMSARIPCEPVWFPVGKIGPTSANRILSNTANCRKQTVAAVYDRLTVAAVYDRRKFQQNSSFSSGSLTVTDRRYSLFSSLERPFLMNASAFSNQASANCFAISPPVSKLTTTKPDPNKSAARSR
jgi:hypothetical protein